MFPLRHPLQTLHAEYKDSDDHSPRALRSNFHTENRRVSGIFNLLCKNTILFIQDLCFHPAQAGSFYFYLDHCRCIADRMDLDSIYRNVLLITCPEIHRTVDSCSGIPAAVWLVRIPCDHAVSFCASYFRNPSVST